MGKFAGKAQTDTDRRFQVPVPIFGCQIPPTHTKTHPSARNQPTLAHTCSLTDIFTHKNTDVRSSPTRTPKHSNALNINTCPHLHAFAKIRKDTKFVQISMFSYFPACMHASNPHFALSHMYKFTHSLPPSHTYLKKICEILLVFVCVHLCGHSLSLFLFFLYAS